MRHILLKFAPVLLLAGCTSNLQELKKLEPKATDFPRSLATEYLAYSESEAEQGESSSAEHFAGKGLKAAKGEEVAPDQAGSNSNLADSRAALVDALKTGIKKLSYQKAARAQLLFDCWNNQENNQIFDKVSCAEEFEQAYIELQAIVDSIIYGSDHVNSINFLEGSAEIDDEERNQIKEMTAHLKGKYYKMELKGYYAAADKGALAKERLASVREELVNAGIPKSKILVAKLTPIAKTGKEVVLSVDSEKQDNDKVDIIITSSKHVPGGSND